MHFHTEIAVISCNTPSDNTKLAEAPPQAHAWLRPWIGSAGFAEPIHTFSLNVIVPPHPLQKCPLPLVDLGLHLIRFLGPTRPRPPPDPNDISTESAVFSEFTLVTNGRADRPTDRPTERTIFPTFCLFNCSPTGRPTGHGVL